MVDVELIKSEFNSKIKSNLENKEFEFSNNMPMELLQPIIDFFSENIAPSIPNILEVKVNPILKENQIEVNIDTNDFKGIIVNLYIDIFLNENENINIIKVNNVELQLLLTKIIEMDTSTINSKFQNELKELLMSNEFEFTGEYPIEVPKAIGEKFIIELFDLYKEINGFDVKPIIQNNIFLIKIENGEDLALANILLTYEITPLENGKKKMLIKNVLTNIQNLN